MKTKLVVAMLMAGSTMFAETHFSIGIGLGGYGYAAQPMAVYAPPSPGPGYTWVDGYWDQAGPRRFWRDGYWAAPVYRGGYQAVVPFERQRYDRDDNDREEHRSNFNANREQRFEGNRYSDSGASGRSGNRELNRTDNSRAFRNGYNGNSYSNGQSRQFNNGFGQR